MPLESSITRSILDYLNSLEGCVAEKVKGGASASGRADINACYRGQCLRIEVKTPDHRNKTSVKQEHNLKKWKKAGAITMVVYSLDAVKEFIGCIKKIHAGYYAIVENNGCTSWVDMGGIN